MSEITKDQWGDWKNHPVTIEFIKKMESLRNDGVLELGSGVYAQDTGRTYLVIGAINALTRIIEADYLEG
mgnify:CR=1 FL=1